MKHNARHCYEMHLVTLNFNILLFLKWKCFVSFAPRSSHVTYVGEQIRLILLLWTFCNLNVMAPVTHLS